MSLSAEERAKNKRKEQAELHTMWLNSGLGARHYKPHPPVSPDELAAKQGELVNAFKGKPIWELWCQGDMTRWHILQWAFADMGARGAVAGVGRYFLRGGGGGGGGGGCCVIA